MKYENKHFYTIFFDNGSNWQIQSNRDLLADFKDCIINGVSTLHYEDGVFDLSKVAGITHDGESYL